jgi:vacuolar protein sorting-associated protein 13D
MLEGLVAWLLKTYIGKYVNVNPEKLSVGLLSGIIELENLQINTNEINNTHKSLPFIIKYGHISKVKLNVSLNQLRNTPMAVLADGIYIIISPRLNSDVVNVDNEKDYLNAFENKWFKEVELLDSQANSEQSKWFSFGSMAYNLFKNLHVNINNLHIRYEDVDLNYAVGKDLYPLIVSQPCGCFLIDKLN